ncbi:substrate-binding domain-containing protein [Mesorhizobium comanense]|uniref:substrate-binding domain-containing protein n=1 Tax=Mesorhizobium comanense TaxID=2502215 RepID=UPI001485624A|nr:substrate-binding domain-containing protein [Mesorhizobium comanense]
MKTVSRILSAALLSGAVSVLGSSFAHAGSFDKVDVSPGKVGTVDELQDISKYCGTKPVKVALSDGFGSNSWRKITLAEFKDEAAKCKNITEVRYTDGQGNPQKQISDIQGLIAQKFDVILVFPDSGEALFRVMRQAMNAGIAVVPYSIGETFPGKPGVEYVTLTTESVRDEGRTQAQWIVDTLGAAGGNVISLGGLPGNPLSINLVEGAKEIFKDHPNIKLLEGPVDTNWDPAETQRVMASLLAKYPKIDAVMGDYGLGSVGALRAFVAASRPIPLWAVQDANELACFWEDNKAANPGFKLSTTSSRNWMVRLALRKGMAAAQGINNDEPSIIKLPLFENSDDPGKQPKCNRELPPDALLSSQLTVDQLKQLFK